MSSCKALLPWGNTTVLESIISTAKAGGCERVAVVTGIFHREIATLVSGAEIELINNPHPERGMFSSLQTGLQRRDRRVLIFLVDQPVIAPSLVVSLLAEPERIAQPTFAGHPGHPVHVPLRYLAELRAMPVTETLRDFLHRHHDEIHFVESDHSLADFDTPAEFQRVSTK